MSMLLCLLSVAPSQLSAQTEQMEYYALDAIGSVRVVFDANGAVKGRMDYAPFGEELFSGLYVPTDRFAGLKRDTEAALDYAEARMYLPRTGRFNAVDPIFAGLFDPQQWNRYTYARNNPSVYVDPSGSLLGSFGLFGSNSCSSWFWTDDSGVFHSHNCQSTDEVGGGGGGGIPLEMLLWMWGLSGTAGDGDTGRVVDEGPRGGGVVGSIVDRLVNGGECLLPTAICQKFEEGPQIDPDQIQLGIALPVGPAAAASFGRIGEQLVRSNWNIGPKLKLIVNGRVRFPDGRVGNVINEVKNVEYQGLTAQLRDYISAAQASGGQFILWVRTSTTLSVPLQNAWAQGQVIVRAVIPW